MSDSMNNPKRLPQYHQLTDPETCHPERISFAQGVHSNPRFYKYYWRVFHAGSPFFGEDFFQQCKQICTYEAMNLIKRLEEKGEGYIIYNVASPRTGKDVPFDFTHKRWADCSELITAPPFDDDLDPEYQGHK